MAFCKLGHAVFVCCLHLGIARVTSPIKTGVVGAVAAHNPVTVQVAGPVIDRAGHHHDAADITQNTPALLQKKAPVDATHKDIPQATLSNQDQETLRAPPAALAVAGVLITGTIFVIYRPKGPRVVASVLIYLGALSTMKLAVKWVFVTHAYPYAKFVSALHFFAGLLVTGAVLLKRRDLDVPTPTQFEFFCIIFPIALSVVFSIGANNMALTFVSAGFTEIIGASNCLITILVVMVMGMPFYRPLTLPCMIVAVGCMLGSAGEVNFSVIGMLLCLSSNLFRSLKVALQQKLMTGETKDRFDPCALLFWMSLPATVVMLAASLLTEGLAPYKALASAEADFAGLTLAILVSCVNATILNMAQLFVTKDLGAVGSQLVAQAKMVLTVMGGMVLFGESMSRMEIFGFAMALIGVYIFARMDQDHKDMLAKQRSVPPAGKASEILFSDNVAKTA